MPHPPIQVFLTTIASQTTLRQRQEHVLRILQVKKVQFTSYDLASDEDAKKLWRRKAPLDKQQLPGILVGGEFPGTYQEFEEAVEFGELDQFLRLNEEWEPLADDKLLLRAVPVGVPGAYSPAQMNPGHVSPAPSSSKAKVQTRPGELDAGDKLGDSGLSGVNVTEDDLLKLVEELGLGEADANELVKGLTGDNAATNAAIAYSETKPEEQQTDVAVKAGGAEQPAQKSEEGGKEDKAKTSKEQKEQTSPTEDKEDA